MSHPRRVLAAALVGLVCAVVTPSAAAAHAVLLRATPSSSQTLSELPAQVQLLFSEPLDPVFSAVHVRNPAGQAVDNDDSHVDTANDHLLVASVRPALPNGIYTVSWRSLSAIDVHPDEGQYPLYVGVPVPVATTTAGVASSTAVTTTPATTIGRWWFYVAASLFGGVLAAWKFVVSGPSSELSSELHARTRGRMSRLVILGGCFLIVGTLFTAVAQAAAAANVPFFGAFGQPLGDLLLRGRFASIWWPRLGLEVASLLLIVFGGLDGLASESALATLPAVLLTSALTSHGAALPQGAGPGIAIDWLHLLGATAWVGGLVALSVFLVLLRGHPGQQAVLRHVVGRFGRFALLASLVVLLSGSLQAALELGSFTNLRDTFYGQLVLAKLGALLLMLVLAGFNEWRTQTTAGVVAVSRGLGLELALGVLVLAVAAMLSGTPPSPGTS